MGQAQHAARIEKRPAYSLLVSTGSARWRSLLQRARISSLDSETNLKVVQASVESKVTPKRPFPSASRTCRDR